MTDTELTPEDRRALTDALDCRVDYLLADPELCESEWMDQFVAMRAKLQKILGEHV